MKRPRCACRLPLLALALAFAPAAAQDTEPTGDLLFGITHASYLSEQLRAGPLGGADQWVQVWSGSRVSPTVGAGVSLQLFRLLFFRGEALLVRKGISDRSVVLDQLYLEIPLLIGFKMVWKEPVSFRAVAGLAPSREILCRAKLPAPVEDGSATDGLVTAECGEFRDEGGDIGNVIGAGFGPIRLMGLSLMPEARLVLGGADLLPEQRRDRARHRTFSLLMGVTRAR